MKIEEELLFGYKAKEDALIKYGFKKEQNSFFYITPIMNGEFEAKITISKNLLRAKIIDKSFNEEYSLFNNEHANGEFIGKLREEYKNILLDIREKCFIRALFADPQAERVAKYVKEMYGDDPEFPWKRYPQFGIFRNRLNRRWYGCIMNVEDNKLAPNTKGRFVINVKADKSIFNALLLEENIFPGRHMNKESWISVSLSDYLPDEYVFSLIDMSYEQVNGSKKAKLKK